MNFLPRVTCKNFALHCKNSRCLSSSALLQCESSSKSHSDHSAHVPLNQQLAQGPYQKVGNVIIIELNHQVWQQPWEICRYLRQLNFEFRGQVTVHPDIPEVRERLFHCRHLVNIDIVPIDEIKRSLCIPSHITFSDLLSQFPETWGEHPAAVFDYTNALKKFAQFRKERIRDIMNRDATEMRLVKLRRKIKQTEKATKEASPTEG
ncbi:hypothetical protein XU18_3153 [Perkinsela sp. CCAP 1560/4]|nr:hypothetical protein XU18_3153 [Perkinsela sp. CCAP 1560/4]|eukprot:KNH05876.1 hypothetical protein XU18_3153 [Perkinsela sp. CCAP 1560/4]